MYYQKSEQSFWNIYLSALDLKPHNPKKTEITTHAVKGAILRARVLDTQKPAPPVANQNSDTFWNNEPSFKVPDFFCRVIDFMYSALQLRWVLFFRIAFFVI